MAAMKVRVCGPGGAEEVIEVVGPLRVVEGIELDRLVDDGTGYEYFFVKEDGCYDGFGKPVGGTES